MSPRPQPHLTHAVGGAVLAALAAGAPSVAAEELAAEDVLRRVERRYAVLESLSASFVQSYRSESMGQEVLERGRLFVKRPGRMRWDYRRPDRKVFLVRADGSTLSYVPADRTAVRGRIPAEAPHLRLLLGESDLLRTFSVAEVQLRDPRRAGSRQLKLRPREPMEAIEFVYLELDRDSHAVERVLVVDRLGNESDLVLERVRENAGVRDGVFELDLPAGVTVRGETPGEGG